MRKVVKFDGITLDYPLYISTEFDIDNYIGKKRLAIDGSSVLFVQPKGALTNEVVIESKDNGWVSDSIKNSLIDTMDELEKTIEYDDGTTDVFYYDHTKIPLKFEAIYNGAIWYNVTFNLLKG